MCAEGIPFIVLHLVAGPQVSRRVDGASTPPLRTLAWDERQILVFLGISRVYFDPILRAAEMWRLRY